MVIYMPSTLMGVNVDFNKDIICKAFYDINRAQNNIQQFIDKQENI